MPEPVGSWYLIGAGLAESSPTGPDPRFERLASAKRNIVILENLRSVMDRYGVIATYPEVGV